MANRFLFNPQFREHLAGNWTSYLAAAGVIAIAAGLACWSTGLSLVYLGVTAKSLGLWAARVRSFKRKEN